MIEVAKIPGPAREGLRNTQRQLIVLEVYALGIQFLMGEEILTSERDAGVEKWDPTLKIGPR